MALIEILSRNTELKWRSFEINLVIQGGKALIRNLSRSPELKPRLHF